MIENGFIRWPEDFRQRYRDAGYWQDLTIGEILGDR